MAKVKYIGATDVQVKFGNCDDPRGILDEGHHYDVEEFDVHSWHTKIKLKGFDGAYNSVHFKAVEDEPERTGGER